MESVIILKTSHSDDTRLSLNQNFVEYSGQNVVDVVYQDAEYEYILEGDAFFEKIEYIELFINNKELPIDFKFIDDQDVIKVLVKAKQREGTMPFFLLYGITEITVHIIYINGKSQYLFSSYLAIAVKRYFSDTMDSVKEMLENIYVKDHALLHKGKTQNTFAQPDTHKIVDDKFAQELSMLKTIITTLKKYLPYFLKSPNTITVPNWTVDRFEKLHTIRSRNLNYIVTHPEELRITQGQSGISINKRQLIPERTLVSTQQFSCDTFENREILSFINTLVRYVSHRKYELINALDSTIDIRLKKSILDEYILSTVIIQQYTHLTLKEHLIEIKLFLTQYAEILLQYQRALPCSYTVLHQIPVPTPCFLEVYHYRHLYQLINRWFASGDYTLPNSNTILHFSSADTIYEYFCLLNLYDILVNMGFYEQTEQRTVFHYFCNDSRYIQTQNANTFYFHKDDCEITLYYQPIIYSKDCSTRNGITLFRTDGSYYCPDFIIKKKTSSGITFGILDAKWRPQKVLLGIDKKGGLSELSYKYMYSIVDEKTLQGISFFWLLQGKDDGRQTYYHNHGVISKKQNIHFQNATGIVRLSPKSGNFELAEILRVFLTK